MRVNVKKLMRIETPKWLPVGQYQATWTSYTVSFSVNTIPYELETEVGIRGIDQPCLVHVTEDDIYVELVSG